MFTYETNPIWDENKDRIIGSEHDSFNNSVKINKSLPYFWWRLNDDITNEVQGYGWLVVEDSQVEISLAVAKDHRRKGLAEKILIYVENQILLKGFPKKIVVTVCGTNPHRAKVVKLLQKNNYKPFSFPIKDAAGILERGFDVNFYKDL